MFKFAMFTKMALLALFVLASLIGQPLYAQEQKTAPGTGKTMTGSLLGNVQPSQADTFTPNAGQTVKIQIEAADASTAFVASVQVHQGGGGAGKVSYSDLIIMVRSGEVQCGPNGATVILGGTLYRQVGSQIVAEGDARVRVHRPAGGGGGQDIIVFDIVDSFAKHTVTAPGKFQFQVNPCP
jgi:hypothetical protein